MKLPYKGNWVSTDAAAEEKILYSTRSRARLSHKRTKTLLWSLDVLLSDYERQLSAVCDGAAAVDIDNLDELARQARRLQTQVVE